MDGGQKTPINLEAGLNINTSDMLTPLANQTFQHNWQKYQGKFLPNSLRFEKNGWAAGWNVYNFDYNAYRSEQHGYYVGLGQLNTYVKTLNIYDSENSYNSIHTVYVVPDTVITVGDLTVNGNTISGRVKDKNFQLTWDPVTHTLSCADPTIELTQVVNGDYSVAFIVKDLLSSFSYDFNLLLHSKLTGDAITGISYDGFSNNVHSWGQYTYNVNTGVLTTPEGVTVNPTVSGNEISFDYVQDIIDETVNVQYVLSKFYPRFSNITYQDQTNKEKLLIASGSEQLAFNRYKAGVTPNILNARDEDGVIIDWQLPLWLTAKLGVNRADSEAKKCDNTRNYEIATMQGSGLNMGGVYNNIWDGDGTFTIDNVYRPRYTKYLNGITHRFNQIFLNNTITLSPNWDYKKHLLNSQVWYADSRRYANIRNRRTADMTKLLGNVYTWGTFSVDPRTVFDYNEPYDVSVANNCIYTKEDISQILTFKLSGAADNTNEGEDQDFINNNLTIDETLIATFSGTVTEYDPAQAAEEYADVYTGGEYTGTSYETVGISEEPFWPFEKVPKFNFKDAGGNIHAGVYWTDGTNFIDDFDIFRAKVLGAYDNTVDKMNSAISDNASYNRTRIVNHYAAGYDFYFYKKSSYNSQQEYADDVNAWNEIWKKYYPNTPSPQDTFDETASSDDDTYFDFIDIIVNRNVDPKIQYVEPGVYLFGVYAVPYDCPSGLIIFNDGSDYSLSANVWHHATQVDSQYDLNYKHEAGVITFNGAGVNIPFYFGSASSDNLVSGVSSNSFRQISGRAYLNSARLTIGVNYEYRQVRHEATYEHGTYVWYTWEWVRTSPQNTNWLGNLLAYYSSGRVTISDAALNTGVEPVQRYYYVGDVNSGIKFAWPIWGHRQRRNHPCMGN